MPNFEKDFTVVESTVEGAGAMTYWTLRGAVQHALLKQEWLAQGLHEDLLLAAPSDEKLLRRAVEDLASGDLFVETIKSTGELALVYKTEQDGLPKYTPMAKWKLAPTGRPGAANESVPVQTFSEDGDTSLHDIVLASFMRGLGRVTSEDVSVWLTRLVSGNYMQGVVARPETGGIYYVPPFTIGEWRKVKAVLDKVTNHQILNVPMVKNDEAIETIYTATMNEMKKVAASLQKELENADNKREDGLKTQAEKAALAKAKLARLEQFMGRTMPEVNEQLENLRADLFAAAAIAGDKK